MPQNANVLVISPESFSLIVQRFTPLKKQNIIYFYAPTQIRQYECKCDSSCGVLASVAGLPLIKSDQHNTRKGLHVIIIIAYFVINI